MLTVYSGSHTSAAVRYKQTKVFFLIFYQKQAALGYPWPPNFPLCSISHHRSCLPFPAFSTKGPSWGLSHVVGPCRGWAESAMNFLPEVINIEVVQTRHDWFFLRGYLGLCLRELLPWFLICSFILCVSQKCTQIHTRGMNTITSLEIKHFKGFFLPFFVLCPSSSYCLVMPTSFHILSVSPPLHLWVIHLLGSGLL